MLKVFMRQFMLTVMALAATILAGDWAVRYAYENRGYKAVGGEYLFIFIIYMMAYVGSNWLWDILKEIRCHRNEGR